MNETPDVVVPENIIPTLEGVCQSVTELYAGVDKIQLQRNTGRHVSFRVIPKKDVDLEPLFSDIKQAILVGVSRIGGVRCSVHDIRIAEIMSNDTGTGDDENVINTMRRAQDELNGVDVPDSPGFGASLFLRLAHVGRRIFPK